jgi:hypothetical protein
MKTFLATTALLATFFAAAEAQAQRTSYAAEAGARSRYSGSGAATGSRLPFSGDARGGGRGAFGSGRGLAGGDVGAFGGTGGMGDASGQQDMRGQLDAPLADAGGQQFEEGGFVGRDAEDVRGTFDNLSGRERRDMMMDMMIENYNEMRESRRRWRDQETPQGPVRVRLKPAPELISAAGSFATPNAVVQARINQALASRGIAAEVVLSGRTAILRGVVASERDALLMAQLAALEPGVSQVENQLALGAPEAIPPQALNSLP